MSKNGLTPKQHIFILEYLVDKNATRAAKAAGYSARTARSIGAENLTKPYIWAEIAKGLREQLDKAEITAENILQQLKLTAFADIYGGHSSRPLRALELLGKAIGLFNTKPIPQTEGLLSLDLLAPVHKGFGASN